MMAEVCRQGIAPREGRAENYAFRTKDDDPAFSASTTGRRGFATPPPVSGFLPQNRSFPPLRWHSSSPTNDGSAKSNSVLGPSHPGNELPSQKRARNYISTSSFVAAESKESLFYPLLIHSRRFLKETTCFPLSFSLTIR
ncbi:hypothetical protein HPB50_024260 [Hyalomma asiaticum]|uniref:Uncharacterized protein n=1 Tax=Hyalomma asiaticum TaxID=266040 RepID=A0ACB7SCI0_HYAAI|nr:hypothetical protein HPB50_024260 [Hyalomma asiaticum]